MQRFCFVIFLFFVISFPLQGYAGHAATRILVLGDSLSAAHNIPIDQGWVSLFDDNMGSRFARTSVINASISGETTFGGRQRLPALLENHAPTHLIIELGGNDGLRGLNLEQTTDNLRAMVRLARERDITVLLIGVRMPPNFGAAYNRRFQSVFEDTASEPGVHYLPRFLDGIAASDPSLMQSDGIHPTAIAQPLLAEKVTRRMVEIIRH